MTIQQILSNIRTAVYGRELRRSIHDGLEKCYSERLQGGRNPVSDINNFYTGIALFSATTTNRPFNTEFMLIAAGNETNCYQVAYSVGNSQAPLSRRKQNGSWTAWARFK